jgi:hypothetical protein
MSRVSEIDRGWFMGVASETKKINTRKMHNVGEASNKKNFVYQKIDLNEDTRESEVGRMIKRMI